MGEIQAILLPTADLRPEDFSILTEKRQKILISLLKEELTVSRLSEKEEIGLSQSSISEALELLQTRNLIKKNDNKVFSLTTKGKLLTLSLLKPNGILEPQICELLDKVLKEEFNIEDSEYRQEIIENCRQSGKDIQAKICHQIGKEIQAEIT